MECIDKQSNRILICWLVVCREMWRGIIEQCRDNSGQNTASLLALRNFIDGSLTAVT